MNNLKRIDLDIPIGQMVVVCGVSGSGKTSLVLDTLHAEGKRRFMETLAAPVRQFLQRIEKPDFDHLENLPASIAIARPSFASGNASDVGSQTELADYMRLLFSKASRLYCTQCNREIRPHTPQSVAQWIATLSKETKVMICNRFEWETRTDLGMRLAELQSSGFVRTIFQGKTFHLAHDSRQSLAESIPSQGHGWVVVDRINGGSLTSRTTESLESAFARDRQGIVLMVASNHLPAIPNEESFLEVEGKGYEIHWFATRRRCQQCHLDYPDPIPNLFHPHRLEGGCRHCHGKGVVSQKPCPDCNGARLQATSLAFRIGAWPLTEWSDMPLLKLHATLKSLDWPEFDHSSVASILEEIERRLLYLIDVGLGHLSLGRGAESLSSGEMQRLALTIAMGSSLTSMLYVLDEPTSGLHTSEVPKIVDAIRGLRDRGNTVVVISHDRLLLESADQILELGPAAGEEGGHVTFQGSQEEFSQSESITSKFLAGRQGALSLRSARKSPRGQLTIHHARCNNLQDLSVTFPLGVLCLITGVSGSGKTSLIQHALYTGLQKKVGKNLDDWIADNIHSTEEISDVVMIDQSLLARSHRSVPATILKILDEIREVFAGTIDAKVRNMNPSHFSFNHEEGRCEGCQGTGFQEIDMHFLADIHIECPECRGTRFRKAVLEIRYRDRTIADVLKMTAGEALPFFRGHGKAQDRIQRMIDVGLRYLRLGQPGNQLSMGELQRLRLASHLGASSRKRTLFLIDEPTSGLHFADVIPLIDCFQKLLDQGHSLIVIDHHEQLLFAADHIIELGPGAGADGGRVVAAGSPELLQRDLDSKTGDWIRSRIRTHRPDFE